jgi:hypothetical protein
LAPLVSRSPSSALEERRGQSCGRQRRERQREKIGRRELQIQFSGELAELMLDERAAALGVALLHERIGKRATRLLHIELGSKPGVEPRVGDVERVAARADGVVEYSDLRIERAQREVRLGDRPRERDPYGVARILGAEQIGTRRLRGASEAAPEIDLEVGRRGERVVRADDRKAGRHRR